MFSQNLKNCFLYSINLHMGIFTTTTLTKSKTSEDTNTNTNESLLRRQDACP